MSLIAYTNGIDSSIVDDLMIQAIEKKFATNDNPQIQIYIAQESFATQQITQHGLQK